MAIIQKVGSYRICFMDIKEMYGRASDNGGWIINMREYGVDKYYKDVVREILRAHHLGVKDVYLVKNAPYVRADYDYGR